MLLTPLPSVTNCHTSSDPLERDVLYGRPILETFIVFYSLIYRFLQATTEDHGCIF